MIKSSIKKDLLKLGLTESEIKFYIAGLELGLDTVPQIAERAGLSRMSGYNIFKTLNSKGLAEMDLRSYGQKVKCAKPAKLLTLFEEQRRDLDKLAANLPQVVGELNVVYSTVPEELEIHYFRSKDAVIKIWNDALNTTKKGDEILVMSSVNYLPTMQEKYMEFLEEIAWRRQEKGINQKILIERSSPPQLSKKEITRLLGEQRYIDAGLTSDQIIYANKVAYIMPGTELFGITVLSEELHNNIAKLFYKLWKAEKSSA
ncbi:MAG: helix-turn-helix domain-containing protein [Patescibacteria group bacterium]